MEKITEILNSEAFSLSYSEAFLDPESHEFSIQNLLSLPLTRIVEIRDYLRKYVELNNESSLPNILHYKVKIDLK